MSAIWRATRRPPDLLPSLRLYFDSLITTVLYVIIVAAGLLLLIVPGVLLAVRHGFFGFLVIDKGLDPASAFRQSAQMTKNVRGELFVFGLLLLGRNILGAMCLGVGLFVTMPVSVMAAACVYRRLLRAHGKLQ